MDSLILQTLIGAIIIFFSSMTQGIASFGFSLLALPLLGLFLPLRIIVPVLIIYSFILNSIILYNIRQHINLKRIYIVAIFGIIATPFGAHLLKIMDENTLKIIIGVIITISTLANFLGYKFKVKNEKLSYMPIGLVSGLLNGSVSLAGPPLVLFLSNQGVEKQIFRANLTLYFWILNVITIPTYFFSGLITQEVVNYSAYLFPGLIVGTLLGIGVGNKVDELLFKKLAMSLIMAMGLLSIVSGI
ncbi:sulfite exporter TauE/SafE family protein [Alkalicella caledoniensis]|uniref:Probable membrane transporter protein n=1 Tax=Alkalicella caledoniensis TaxID=2731377 RepID=A0A7G9W7L3_ALKCA|nr:sulfite exporter TauE/SafE family protein [Alkalicella caledoniensis]QNO14675.1 sulfite exporter TauE/SafE family protein [Alkalicella caledoniensis]